MERNYTDELSKKIQQTTGKSMKWLENKKNGPDHCPTITVTLELPLGFPGPRKYNLEGKPGENQKIVKNRLSKSILDRY